jgi:hypothetical protein
MEGSRPADVQGRRQKKARIGFDYVPSTVDDQSRLAYSEIRPTKRASPAVRS